MSAIRWPARPAWLPRLTLRGGIFLVVGVGVFLDALILNRRDLLFVGCLLVTVPVAAVVSVGLATARVRVARAFLPTIVPAGGDVIVALRLRNLSARPLSGARWRDTSPPGITAPTSALLPVLDRFEGGPPGGADTVRLEYTLTPARRGLYEVGPLLLGRHDPFGLAFIERAVDEPRDLIVTPRITSLPGSGLSITSGDGSIHELLRHLNPSADELTAREYRAGDPLRRVNWPATARHGEIMVRQEEQRSNPEARILLDTVLGGLPGHVPAPGHRDRLDAAFELAVELVASVGVHLLDAGFRIHVLELGPGQLLPAPQQDRGGLRGDAPVSFRAPGGDRLLLEGLAALVPVPPSDRADTAGEPLRAALGGGGHLPTFAVLVDLSEQDAAELAALRGQADPAVAFVLDTMRPAALDRLRDAGWHCIGLRTVRDIPAAWDEVQRERGAVHDPG